MSTSTLRGNCTATAAASELATPSRLADYLQLTKPKIAVLELVTVVVAAVLAGVTDGWVLLHAVIGTSLVAASASAWNQWIERDLDRRMQRTADRPIAAGRLGRREALVFGWTTLVIGVIYLAVLVNWLTAALALASWLLYVVIYTPLKRISPVNTLVGAIAGAVPILMGWTAMGQPLSLQAFSLAIIVFLWQFPHFMAIAWLYRHQYSAAGMQMLPVVDPSGIRAGAQSVVAALLLLPVSLVPATSPLTGNLYLYSASALLLGVLYLAASVWFLLRLDDHAARRLLHASLFYLPGLLLLMMI